jgi:ATP-dependent exoDNAse (exonuclease V) alpha subunit
VKVLLTAPTGMAAYNIGGTTLHNAFVLPLNQNQGGLGKLNDDVCNTLYCKLQDCKIVIIDEISMVSSAQLSMVSSRLKRIFKSNETFGGKTVIVFGGKYDLNIGV